MVVLLPSTFLDVLKDTEKEKKKKKESTFLDESCMVPSACSGIDEYFHIFG